jgi:hypothetical protein
MQISKKLKDDVNVCFNHWAVDRKEAKFEIERIKANIVDAERCYDDIADKIKRGLSNGS